MEVKSEGCQHLLNLPSTMTLASRLSKTASQYSVENAFCVYELRRELVCQWRSEVTEDLRFTNTIATTNDTLDPVHWNLSGGATFCEPVCPLSLSPRNSQREKQEHHTSLPSCTQHSSMQLKPPLFTLVTTISVLSPVSLFMFPKRVQYLWMW